MIAQMKALLHVKSLKEEKALREMRAARHKLQAACLESERALAIVEESARTYRSREDAIYADIIGSIIDQNEVDTMHGKIVVLEKRHGALQEALDRARYIEKRYADELSEATERFQIEQKKTDKFRLITEELVSVAAAGVERHEEAEVEELFATPRKRLA